MVAVGQIFSHLFVQGSRIYRRQERFERLGQLAGRRGPGLVPVLVCLGARRLRVGEQQAVSRSVVFFHAREPVEPSAP